MPDEGENWTPDQDRRSYPLLPITELQELKTAFREFTAEIRDLRREMVSEIKAVAKTAEDTFLRKETFNEIKKRWDLEFIDVHKDIDSVQKQRTTDENWRKNVNLTIALAVMSNIILIVLGLIGFVLRK